MSQETGVRPPPHSRMRGAMIRFIAHFHHSFFLSAALLQAADEHGCQFTMRPFSDDDADGHRNQHQRRKRRRSASSRLSTTRSTLVVAALMTCPPQVILSFSASPDRQRHVVKVCQNKDCRTRYAPRSPDGSLVQTLQDLLLPSNDDKLSPSSHIEIESSGCLSQCGKGPNICVETQGGKERLFFGVDSASTAAAILDVACDYDPPVNLIIAADKIFKAQTGE